MANHEQRKTQLVHPPQWLSQRDPDLGALRRAGRAAIVMPGVFALGEEVIGDPALALFAAFGSFALLLMVDFRGPTLDRLRNQATLVVACCALICLGTLVSQTAWLAALTMAAVGFVVLFVGVVSSVLAGASTALLRWQDLGRQIALRDHRAPQQKAGVDSLRVLGRHRAADGATRAVRADHHLDLVARSIPRYTGGLSPRPVTSASNRTSTPRPPPWTPR